MIIRISSKFGAVDSVHKTPHKGIDLAMKEGTPLHSIGDGVVDRVFDGSDAIGKGLSIKFPDGTRAIYGHMNEVKTQVGDKVHAGDVIGLSGNTGRSTGPHLHFGMKDADGNVIDPTPFIDRFIANGRVGDGYGDIPDFNLWRWLGEKVSEVTVNGVTDYLADFIVAFPIIAIVSAGVYAFLNMVHKGVAQWGVIGTVVYGCIALLT